MHPKHLLLWPMVFLVAACAPGPVRVETHPAAVEQPAAMEQPAAAQPLPTAGIVEQSPTPVSTPATAAMPSIVPSHTPHAPAVCSPLQDIPFETLGGMISNPYHPPKPGYDDPHAGIDLAVQLPGSQVAVAGHPVQAAMAGHVAMVSADRFPFGNALIIETPLESLPEAWQTGAEVPPAAPTLVPRSALTCPPYPGQIDADNPRRSVYTLYAHLQAAPAWNVGDAVACGQPIGSVGGSGNALNPHLHYETRAGPSGIQLPAIAHYDSSATSQEMSAYCLWSVSGLFQLIDPQKALGIHLAAQ